MKKNIIIIVLAAVLAAAVYMAYRTFGQVQGTLPGTQSQDSGGAESAGDAPDFTLTDLDGNKVSLSDFRGQYVYLNFWASWCPPCKAEMPDIEKIHREYKDKGLVVLAVDLGEGRADVEEFIESGGYTFSVLLDQGGSAAKEFGVSAIPVSCFIDKEGNIAEKRVGALSGEQMRTIIQEMMKE